MAAGSLAHSGRDGHLGGGRTAAERREAARAACPVTVVTRAGRDGAEFGSNLALLRQALRPGAHLPLLQAEHGMDHAEGAPPRAGRSMDVAGFGSFHPAEAGAGVRCGPKATVGAPLRRRSPDTGTGPPGSFVAFGAPGHARQAAETLRQITRQAQRQSLGPGDTLPDDKEGSLKTQEDGQRGFCDELYVHRKTPPG